MAARRDWEGEERILKAEIPEAERKLAEWRESAEGKSYADAVRAFEAADKATDEAREMRQDTERALAVDLGIRKATDRVFTKRFLAAAAMQIGCTREEAEAHLTGLPSLEGRRVSGVQLYDRLLSLFEDKIIEAHPDMIAAVKTADAAYKAEVKARGEKEAIYYKHRDIINGPEMAKRALDRFYYEKREWEEKTAKRKEKVEAQASKDPAIVERFAGIKARLMIIYEKHAPKSQGYGKAVKPGAPVDWWPPSESKEKAS